MPNPIITEEEAQAFVRLMDGQPRHVRRVVMGGLRRMANEEFPSGASNGLYRVRRDAQLLIKYVNEILARRWNENVRNCSDV